VTTPNIMKDEPLEAVGRFDSDDSDVDINWKTNRRSD
jgi:hypothetical protein